MTDEQKQIACAKACGWEFKPQHGPLDLPWRKPNVPAWDGDNWSGRSSDVPLYLTDANAALTLCDVLAEDRWAFHVERLSFSKLYWVSLTRLRGSGETDEVISVHNETLPSAIVDAFLKAIGKAES